MDDQQRARQMVGQFLATQGWAGEFAAIALETNPQAVRLSGSDAIALVAAALRAAPEGWSFQRQDDGSIIVTADGYGVVHVRSDDSDSIAAAMLHLLANDLAAHLRGAKDA